MAQDKDWKNKYKAIVQELEKKESVWSEADALLRKTIGRLSIAGRGIDTRLDDQLKHIQKLAREKKDSQLTDALDRLSHVIASLDDSPAESPPAPARQDVAGQVADTAALLRSLLREIRFRQDQRDELKSVSSDLYRLLGEGGGAENLAPQIGRLSALINDNFGGVEAVKEAVVEPPQPAPEPTAEPTARAVLTTLVEKLASVQYGGRPLQLGAEVLERLDDGNWPELLDRIVDHLSETLNNLNREKSELEDFIIQVTRQLGRISEVIAAEQKDNQAGYEDRQSLQQMMRDSMKSIEADFDTASEIGQVKNILARNLHQIESGIESFVSRANRRQEAIDERNSRLASQILAMDRKTQALKQKLSENRTMLLFDSLTGVGSRISYEEALDKELARWARYGEIFSYVILDIDHFKQINDTYGHSAGDRALKIITKMMMSQIRKSDALFRIGGEEFVLLLPNTGVDRAMFLVDKLRETVAGSDIHFNQQRVVITLSAGLTEPRENDSPESLYERADSALYRAKNAGRNRQYVG